MNSYGYHKNSYIYIDDTFYTLGENMDIKNFFKEKLATVMFLELKPERVETLFKIPTNEQIYFPLRAEKMNSLVMSGNSERIPLGFFIEGFFMLSELIQTLSLI